MSVCRRKSKQAFFPKDKTNSKWVQLVKDYVKPGVLASVKPDEKIQNVINVESISIEEGIKNKECVDVMKAVDLRPSTSVCPCDKDCTVPIEADHESCVPRNRLKILSVNVCGIIKKLDIPAFGEECSQYDVICMCESKTDEACQDLVSEKFKALGFDVCFKNRRQMSRLKSGGILIAVKASLNFKFCKSKSKAVQWLIISDPLQEKDLVIGAVYIPPRGSPYSDIEMFSEVESELMDYDLDYHDVLICGDFNSHVGKDDDYMVLDRKLLLSVGIDDHVRNRIDVIKNLKKLGISPRD